jgi:hypothetical protein
MDRIDTRRLADILEAAPATARLGLTASNSALRTRAAERIALIIVDQLEATPPFVPDERQMTLPIL